MASSLSLKIPTLISSMALVLLWIVVFFHAVPTVEGSYNAPLIYTAAKEAGLNSTKVFINRSMHELNSTFTKVLQAQQEKCQILDSLSPSGLQPCWQCLSHLNHSIDRNMDFLTSVLHTTIPRRQELAAVPHGNGTTFEALERSSIYDTVDQVIIHAVRDWSIEGIAMQQPLWQAVLHSLRSHLGNATAKHRILIPGAGAAGLPWYLSQQGFRVEAFDSSLSMLKTAQAMLSAIACQHNGTSCAGNYTLYPFAYYKRNVVACEQRNQGFQVPWMGSNASQLPNPLNFIYRHETVAAAYHRYKGIPPSFDAVVTYFVIDAIPDLMHAIELVQAALKPGGVWINAGPLHYHFESPQASGESSGAADTNEISSFGEGHQWHGDELLSILSLVGFDIAATSFLDCPYFPDPGFLWRETYVCMQFTAAW